MMRSLFSGVSGLKNHQTRMDVIGNNISNVNTTGFKSSRVNFEDTISQTLSAASSGGDNVGGTNPKQIGLGSKISAIDVNFKDGSVQSTGINTDLCLSGNALFIVKQGNQTFYTRNGAFNFDNQGNLVNAEGLYVQGYMNESTTEHNSVNTAGATTSITIRAGKTMPSSATQKANYINNLNASAATISSMSVTKVIDSFSDLVPDAGDSTTGKVTIGDKRYDSITIKFKDTTKMTNVTSGTYSVGGTAAMPYDSSSTEKGVEIDGTNNTAAVLTMSDGTTQTVTSGKYEVGHSIPLSTTVKVYDSEGMAHVVPITVEKTGANEWVAKLAKTQITEDDSSITTLKMQDTTITFTENGAFKEGTATLSLSYSNGNGAADQDVTISFDKLTQYANSSTINAEADGYASGTLDTVTIDESGTVVGTYTNGILRKEAQVAVAQFTNAPGLTKKGNSLYVESNNSGTPNIGTADTFGATITAAALEMSNVDVAEEFSNMIITQRGFQSNSKIITVSDEMLENLINMKR